MNNGNDPFLAATGGSRAWLDRAAHVLPAGVSYAIRDFPPHPFFVDRAAGSQVWDVDGNAYTDYWMGHGALLLGHAPPAVTRALRTQLERGTHYGYAHTLEVLLAELVTRMVPCAELIRYTNSGTEANMYALGLTRCHTRRRRIAKIEGGWHGGSESLQKGVHSPYTTAEAAGLNPHALEDTVVLPFNDLEAVRDALAGHDIACLLLEPMLGAAGCIPPIEGYLQGVRDVCNETGTLLVFDEVITGFRLARGGAQQRYGVTPDVAVLGKILGGGLPIGAICGRREIMERLDHHRFPSPVERAFHGGTFAGNPATMTAGIAVLQALEEDGIYEDLERLGDRAKIALTGVFGRHGVPGVITGAGSAFAIHFQPEAPRNAREAARSDTARATALHRFLLNRRIAYLTPAVPHFFLSRAHTEDDVSRLVDAVEAFVKSA